MKKGLFILMAALISITTAWGQSLSKFSTELRAELNNRPSATEQFRVLIVMAEEYDQVQMTRQIQYMNKAERRAFVSNELQTFAKASQSNLMQILEEGAKNGSVNELTQLWISNSIGCTMTREMLASIEQRDDILVIESDEYRNMLPSNETAKPVNSLSNFGTSSSSMANRGTAWHVSQVNADDVWTYNGSTGYTGSGVVVAIIDTGVKLTHNDIKNHLWTNSQGYHGYDYVNGDNDPTDDNGHGSHCAGIVAGDGTSGTKTGMAPGAQIMALKVLGANGSGSNSNIQSAMQYAMNNGADIVSMSLGSAGGSGNASERNIFVNMMNAGIIATLAAGNEGEEYSTYSVPNNVGSPGNCPPPWHNPDQTLTGGASAVVCVGASQRNDRKATFSSFGPVTWYGVSGYNDYRYQSGSNTNIGLIRPDVIVPGADITSLNYSGTSGYTEMCGTSMATPGCAGILALMLSAKPSLTPAQMDEILETTALPSDFQTKKNNNTGAGRADALAAIDAIFTSATKPTNLNVTTCGGNVNLTWTASTAPAGYCIYRDNVQVATNVSGTSYTDQNAGVGKHVYYVRANDNNNRQSVHSNCVVCTIEPYASIPQNLTGNLNGNTVDLSWQASTATNAPAEVTLSFTNTYSSYMALQGATIYAGAVRYLPEELGQYKGMSLDKVSFYAYSTGVSHTLRIYRGTTYGNTTGTPVATKTFTPSARGWMDITLDTPYALSDVTTDLWVTVGASSGYPATYGSYNGPSSECFYVALSNSPNSFVWTHLPDNGSDFNDAMCLKTHFTRTTTYTPTYNVYRNDNGIAQNLSNTTYNDANPVSSNSYYVTSKVGNNESCPSQAFEIGLGNIAITATANPAAGGTITGAGSYLENATCTLTATPNIGYNFVNWTENSQQVSTNAAYSFTVTGPRTLVANFESIPQNNITYASVSNGTISGPASSYPGQTVTLTATPASGYVLGSWNVYKTGTPSTTVTVTNNQFVMPSYDVTVSATFINNPEYAINLACGMEHGTFSSDHSSAIAGTTITLSATAEEGYSLAGWVVCKADDPTVTVGVSNNTFTMPGYDVNVAALFPADEVPDTYFVGTDGSLSTNNNLPTTMYYKYSLTQSIYTPTQLGTGACTITHIAYYYNATNAETRTVDLYMAHTTTSNFGTTTSWIKPTAANKVYSGTLSCSTQGWCLIKLDTPFVYNGTSNLVITFDDNTGNDASGNRAFYAFSASNNVSIYYRSDSSNPNPTSVTQTASGRSSVLPVLALILDVDQPSSENVAVVPCELSGFEYDEGWGPSDSQPVTVISAYLNNNITVTAPTHYEVSSTVDGTYAASVTIPATIPQPGISTYNFESGFDGWTTLDKDGDGKNWYSSSEYDTYCLSSKPYAHSGANCMISMSFDNCSKSGPLTPENYLISPEIDLGGFITFYAREANTEYGSEILGVYVSTAANPTQFTQVGADIQISTTDYEQINIDLSAYSGRGHVAICHHNCTDIFYVMIDDVTIGGPGASVSTLPDGVYIGSVYARLKADLDEGEYNNETLTLTSGTATASTTLNGEVLPSGVHYDVTVSADPAQGGTVAGGGSFVEGRTITVTATPNFGYNFVNWTEGNQEVSTDASYVFTVSGERTLVAHFVEIPKSNITYASVSNGTISGPAKAYPTEMVTLIATPADGYKFGTWKVYKTSDPEVTVEVVNDQFSMPSYDVTVTATFIERTEKDIVVACGIRHGSVTTDYTTAESGTKIKVTATPASTDYILGGVVVFNTDDPTELVYFNNATMTFTMPDFNVTVSASFTLDVPSVYQYPIGTEGNVTANAYIPTRIANSYSLSQCIYTPTQLDNFTGKIIGMAYYNNTAISNTVTRSVDVYLSTTTTTSFNSNRAWIRESSDNKVFSGNWEIEAQGWNVIAFNNYFEYNGTSNLLVTVDDNTASAVSSGMNFYTFSGNSNNSIYYASNNTNLNPTQSITQNAAGRTANLPVVIFLVANENTYEMDDAVAVSPCELTGLDYSLGNGPSDAKLVNVIRTNSFIPAQVTAPTHYEISKSPEGPFSSSLYLADEWLHYDEGECLTNVGAGGTCYWGSMFPSNMLPAYAGGSLTKVCTYANESTPGSYTLNIYTGGDDAPQTLVHTQNFTPGTTEGMIDINLTTPITIDATKNLWITFYQSGTDYPASACADMGTPNNRWVSVDGEEWFDLDETSLSGYSWIIRGYVDMETRGGELVELPAFKGNVGGELAMTSHKLNTGVRGPQVFDFEDGTQGWTSIDADGDGYGWIYEDSGSTPHMTPHAGNGCMYSESYRNDSKGGNTKEKEHNRGALTPNNWLVSPQVELGGVMSFFATGQDADWAEEHFAVYVSTTGNQVANFTDAPLLETNSTGEYLEYIVDLSSYSGTGYIAIRHYNVTDMFCLNVDDITIHPAGYTPEPVMPIGFNISQVYARLKAGLEEGEYNDETMTVTCNGYSTEVTLNGQVISTLHVIDDEQTIDGDLVIDADNQYLITEDGILIVNGTVTNDDPANLVIEDGGQFFCNSNNVQATFHKIIEKTTDETDGWYTIAAPMTNPTIQNLTANTFDIFEYDEDADQEEWQNYRVNNFAFVPGHGYLYANSAATGEDSTDLIMTGTLVPSNQTVQVELSFAATFEDIRGYNLIGNPYPHNISMSNVKVGGTAITEFYRLRNGDQLERITSGEILPGESFFIKATATGQTVIINNK